MTAAPDQDRLRLLHLLSTKAYSDDGETTLSSGKKTDFYIDAKLVTYDPEGADLVGRVMWRLLQPYLVTAVGGLTIGADSIAAATAIISHQEGSPLPAFVVRKVAKAHGRQKWIEGPVLVPGMRVAVVDDVVTSGRSILDAIHRVLDVGCKVAVISCLVDREEGGRKALEDGGYEFSPVYTIRDILAARARLRRLSAGIGNGPMRPTGTDD